MLALKDGYFFAQVCIFIVELIDAAAQFIDDDANATRRLADDLVAHHLGVFCGVGFWAYDDVQPIFGSQMVNVPSEFLVPNKGTECVYPPCEYAT